MLQRTAMRVTTQRSGPEGARSGSGQVRVFRVGACPVKISGTRRARLGYFHYATRVSKPGNGRLGTSWVGPHPPAPAGRVT